MSPENRKPLVFWYIYFSEYRKRPVEWNGLKIFLTSMSAECWYSCLFHNRAYCLIVNLLWFFQCTQEVWKVSMFPELNWFQGKLLSNCFHWVFMAISWNNIFFYDSIYFKLIKTNGLMYSLNKSSFRMLFRL